MQYIVRLCRLLNRCFLYNQRCVPSLDRAVALKRNRAISAFTGNFSKALSHVCCWPEHEAPGDEGGEEGCSGSAAFATRSAIAQCCTDMKHCMVHSVVTLNAAARSPLFCFSALWQFVFFFVFPRSLALLFILIYRHVFSRPNRGAVRHFLQ